MSKRILCYRLEPVYEDPRTRLGLSTAAVATCMATGEILDGMGGGGLFLSKKIVDALNAGVNNVAKVVIDASEYDDLMRIAKSQ